jgi:SAM-dependent methyltransferase
MRATAEAENEAGEFVTPCDAGPACARLQREVGEFLEIDGRLPLPATELLHATASAMHGIAAAISSCEAAGYSRERLRSMLAEARRVHARSPLVKRLQTWPRGYPGDFETVEWLCNARNHAVPGSLAWAIEQCALQSPIAQQHRNKVGIQAHAMLAQVLAERGSRIASIGCGGCRDLSLVQDFMPADAGHFVLVDADQDALAFARERLPRLASRAQFVAGSVPRVLTRLEPASFDLVVAGGLFDYLPERWAVATLKQVVRLLRPAGRLLFSNIVARHPFQPWLEYLGDWELIGRDRHDLEQLLAAAGFSVETARIDHDSSGLAVLVETGICARDPKA